MFRDRRKSLFLVAVLIGIAVCVVSVQAACEKGCDCLTPAEAKKVGYEYCGGVRTSCGTSLLEPKYCYGKPAEAIGCPSGSTSCGGSCVDTRTSSAHCGSCNHACPTGATCQGGTCVCGTGLTACSLDPYSPVSKTSPKNFICANLQADESNCGACGNACGSGETCCNGVCGDLRTDERNCGACGHLCPSGQSCTAGHCSTSGTEAAPCPSGCECLTEDGAAERFGGSYARCTEVQKPCGVEARTDPSRLSSPSVVSKYCFKKYADCPAGCGCLLPSEASARDYTLCGGVQTVCGSQLVAGGTLASVKSDFLEKFCYLLRSPVPCAASCSCMDPAKADGLGLTSCGEKQVPCDSDSQGRPYYCYHPAGGTLVSEKPVQCAKGCSCLDATKAIAGGYEYCSEIMTLCGYDTTSKSPLYCFEKPVTPVQESPGAPSKGSTAVAEKGAVVPGEQVAKVVTTPGGFFPDIFGMFFRGRCPRGMNRCGDACVNLQSSESHCGACNSPCASGEICEEGVCRVAVAAAGAQMRARPCPEGWINCDDQCFNPKVDELHCGDCGTACADGYTCQDRTCCDPDGCPAPTAWCDGDCVDLQRSESHCGSCDTRCESSQYCINGVCDVIGEGRSDCRSDWLVCGVDCVNPRTDSANCGACGTVCPTGRECQGGSCVCAAGTTECRRDPLGGFTPRKGWNTFCTDTQNDEDNCGACGNACRPDQVCQYGVCMCSDIDQECNGVCVNTGFDQFNCGFCGRRCPYSGRYSDPICCNGLCTDSQTDEANCGRCGNACGSGETCCNGQCENTQTDPHNCGEDCYDCGPDTVCCNGFCSGRSYEEAVGIEPLDPCEACGFNCDTDTEVCCDGECTNVFDDVYDCGACGHNCGGGQVCCPDGYCSGLRTTSNCGSCGYECNFPYNACMLGVCCVTYQASPVDVWTLWCEGGAGLGEVVED